MCVNSKLSEGRARLMSFSGKSQVMGICTERVATLSVLGGGPRKTTVLWKQFCLYLNTWVSVSR